ncbi:hypothetical protein EDC94DRAFT_629699 [Helicostylum pulchrum]|nr:hypothetical protein EDC94DRAFT_629699 [Helicostylum pulchrum]
MQKMINELIVSSIAQPYGFCALLTGLDCRLYAMWLEHDGIYICREIQTFSLPRSFYEVFALSFYTINISSFKRSKKFKQERKGRQACRIFQEKGMICQ